MASRAVQVRGADRMMTAARALSEGNDVVFADGCTGRVPFGDLPEIGALSSLAAITLPNPYEVVLQAHTGDSVELPWDFVRHYCDLTYQQRVDTVGTAGRPTLGRRVRQLREAARQTQAELASSAGIGRVTLVRIENGEQSPRYETLMKLAEALRRPVADLLVDETSA